MHVFIITLIFSIVFSFLSFNRPIQITTFLKISLLSFCIRIAIALISFILLAGSLNLFSSENVEATSIMFIVALYLFSFYVYSKVVLKNFLRVGEVFARFSLDALPGEQMSIESGKRDGIISISEAQSKRSETISNSLKYTSFETVLRLLSSEPVIISMLVVIGVLFGVFDYRTTGDLLKFKLNIVNTLFAGSLILISGFLSLMPISKFTFGSKINEGGSIRLNLSYFYFEIMTYSSITTFLVSVVALAFSVLTNSLGGGRTSFYFLMLAGAIGSLLSLKFRKKSSGSFLILENEFNGVDTFEFNSSDQLLFDHKKGDLVI